MARSLGLELHQFPVRSPNELEKAFDQMAKAGITAVTVADDAMLTANIETIATLANKQRMVSIAQSGFVRVGGLMEYGADIFENYHRAAVFVDKILKGAKPADIPFEQATKFQFGLNLKAAKALGLDVPSIMLVRADEVIE
jgi:putative ABC transport system substrate-binding protein